ncbi:hypothetical protein [Chryseobacterium koreense]|uniref:Uncharacterized protein n=1 Tax=Chryseobacterium koreense CCUG 49689 TaxID=1304281 RepID=A0A0J7IZS1_9FLAO|nr:hypothetical protein [Chryseobacterium koreense]KMQ71326.1 hypothetical protein ACM44_07975 [Chryseobacterium koreense CCUG 49689]MBB5333932.1 hypothetical protein [Chryseobacterium koreense]
MKIRTFFNGAVLAAAGLFAAATTSSFAQKENGELADTTYFYISSDKSEDAFQVVSHWNVTNSNGSCGSLVPNRPCSITVPQGSTLSTVLNGMSNEEILAISSGYKE